MNYFELDEAVRGARTLRDDEGGAVDVQPYIARAMSTWETPLRELLSTVGPLGKFDTIFVVGGASAIFRQALAISHPKLQVSESDAPPLLAIATGFYVLARHDYMRSAEAHGSLPWRPATRAHRASVVR